MNTSTMILTPILFLLAAPLLAHPKEQKVLIEPLPGECPNFVGFPAVAADGRVVMARSHSDDAGNQKSSLLFTKRPTSTKQSQRKIQTLQLCQNDVEGVKNPFLKLFPKRIASAQKRLRAFAPMSKDVSFTFDDQTQKLVVNAGHRKYETTLPKHRVPLFCCDAQSERGTCEVSPNEIRAFIAPYEGVVVVEHRLAHQAEGCSLGPEFKVLRVRKRSKNPSLR